MSEIRQDVNRLGSEDPSASPFRYVPVMIHTMDRDGRLTSANICWLRALGYSDDDVLGRRFDSLLTSPSAERVRDLLRAMAKAERTHVEGVPVTLVRHNGATLSMTMALSLERNAAGEASRILGFLAEDEDEVQARIRERDTWLRAILENAPVEIVLKDRDGRFIAVSRNVALERGADRSAVIGMRTADFFPPEIAAIYEAADSKVIESGIASQQEVKEVEDGKVRYIHNAKFPLRNDSGYIIGVCSLSMDTTEMHRMEEQLFQAQKMEAVGKLTGGIAHDFNNLLMVISGNIELIAATQETESREVQAALRAIERGADLTRRLLAFSRRQFLQPEPVALAVLLDEIRELIHRTMGQTIRLEVNVPADLPTVRADPGQLHNAILNLALNARDAMPEGGTLTISAGKTWLGESLAGVQTEAEPGEYVRLSVSDTGSGIDPEVILNVFEPFFTTKEGGLGSGLGLSMVYGFIKQSGGHVTIDSTVGRGTTVHLFLPLAGSEVGLAAPGAPAPIAIPRGEGETILLVDDEEDIRNMLGNSLRDLGYEVTTVADPEAAIAAIGEAGSFELLITDILLGGGMRGTELARCLVDRQPDLKVLFITGYAGADQGEIELPAGAHLLTKPFARTALAGLLRTMLDARPA